ncbi:MULTISPECIES: helix-turn-helix domain-containing protein [unclassified Aureimonas]|uniref:helix-turn-helix domain-containing protein n=1 Tax=unclassified Aureimonas TaxID=2615206 RepID=UPI000784206B|nr:helix-turn-helix domain-containing protein [Aureimonas sp. N4]
MQEGGREFAGPDPAWFKGAGYSKKLTPSGEEEMVRQFDRGLTDKQIARRFGLSLSAICLRRKRYDLEQAARSYPIDHLS